MMNRMFDETVKTFFSLETHCTFYQDDPTSLRKTIAQNVAQLCSQYNRKIFFQCLSKANDRAHAHVGFFNGGKTIFELSTFWRPGNLNLDRRSASTTDALCLS
jgi:hypothetical protein